MQGKKSGIAQEYTGSDMGGHAFGVCAVCGMWWRLCMQGPPGAYCMSRTVRCTVALKLTCI
jgi:hypothetical protein